MIMDDNLVSIDNASLSGGAITGEAIALTSFSNPGRMTFFLGTYISKDAEGGTGLTLKLQQAATEEDDFEDIDGTEITIPQEGLVPGPVHGYRFLPLGVTKPWIKVIATPAGFTAGTMTSGIMTEEEFPYVTGMYIDKGEVLG